MGNGIIVMVNAATESLFGYPRQELIDCPVEKLIPQRFCHNHPNYRQTYINESKSRPMGHGRNLYGLRKSVREFPVEVRLNPIQTPNGQMVLASVIDITERKQQEERLRSALKEKDLLLAEIHHWVKNNLQIIDRPTWHAIG